MCLIQSLTSKELVRNLPKLKFDQYFCDACKIGKQAQANHKAKNVVSTTRCLELLHMDLFGSFAVWSYGGNRYTLVIVDDYSRKVKESLNVTFYETPPPSKTSPLVDDDLDEEEAIKVTKKKNLENDIVDETLEIDEIVNIKESRNHPLENNVNKALGDESWIVAMQEELNQFIANDVWELVPQPRNMTIIGTKWVFRNKLDENGIISQNKASQYRLSYSDEGQMFVEFVIQNQLFSYSLENFAQILDVPCEGACVFTDRWRLDELAYGIPSDGPYQTNPPSIEDIILSIRIDREGQVRRIRHEEEIDVHDYQILTREIIPTLKPLEEIIRENVFCLGGNRDHVPACLCFMLYCVVHSERFNLAYYMAKRMEWVTKQARLILPYGMLLTRLFTFIMNEYPELNNESYVLYDRVMTPLAAQLERKPRRDRGMRRGRHSTSLSSAFDQPSSSSSSLLNDEIVME
ncbi:pentatricopeptide repeat-containing protein [Tanacetum coccineum]